jgi:hypothetical protein
MTCTRTDVVRTPGTNFSTSRRRAGARTLEIGIEIAPERSRFAPVTCAVLLGASVVVDGGVVVPGDGGVTATVVVVTTVVVLVGAVVVPTVGTVTAVTPGSVTVGSSPSADAC